MRIRSMTRTPVAVSLALVALALCPVAADAQAPLRKIGEMELQLAGLAAGLDPVNPVVPKNTPAGVQVVVRAGGRQLTAAEVESLVGGPFFVEAELNGPGLPRTITTPDLDAGDALPSDPLILPLPGLNTAGDYELANVRIVSGGRAVMGVLPEVATLKVIDQVLVTKLVTRPLTLDELKEKGIEITSRDYTGFQFSLALRLESEVVNLDFPVVFDRKGVVVPQPLDTRENDPTRKVEAPAVPRPPAMIVPVMLLPEGEADAGPQLPLTLPGGDPIRIPSVLVIPGNVGYLKQFFSAVVYVANGTPIGSRLFVRDIAGKIQLPPGDDLDPGNEDDPLYLAKRIGEDVPPFERPVLGIGPDEAPGTEDDVSVFAPGEQGQAEWVLVGNGEGFHKIDIALGATLEGLPTGPVRVKGAATGGVLVRNPFFDVTFTVPSVVRDGETFKAAVTLNNIGQAPANLVTIRLAAGISGLQLIGDPEQSVPQIAAGEAHAFEYTFKSLRTGKVVATYLRFDTQPGAGAQGRVDFTIGVTDEGVPLSPDTLVLPASVSRLPGPVTYAAMRLLGQAWSIANAPRGSLPASVTRMTRGTVEQKALALAEAGLRVTLREPAEQEAALGAALRDLALDFWGGEPVDPGFDRLLRKSEAGRAFADALGSALGPVADAAGGAAAFERALAEVAVSGPDFLSLSVVGAADVALTDSLGRQALFERTPAGARTNDVPGAVLLPLGPPETAPLVGLVTDPVATGYRLDVTGPAAITLTVPQAGSFVRGTVIADGRAVLAIDLARPGDWVLEQDLDGDGTFEHQRPVATETIESQGPELVAAAIIGPETLPRAGAFGLNAVLVFDRPVEAAAASDTQAYSIPDNAVAFAKPQLSGRLVFATLEQPEGPNVPTTVSVTGLADRRGAARSATQPLRSRLERGGAWVSGQVREADGAPVDGGSVVYANITDEGCALGGRPQPLARVPLGSDGSYEIRYVRQGSCGFDVIAADPRNIALRKLEARVRRPGERMFLDIVLLGEGSVEGFVRDLASQAVPGATVVAVSETDKYRGGSTLSDGSGYYRIDGLPVGLVSVRAGRGAGLGSATGRIERAGTAAQVNVTLDAGAVTVSGYFRQVKDGSQVPVASALMTFGVASGPAGYVFTDETGFYRFEGMPVGSFTIQGRGYGPFGEASASGSGSATAGQSLGLDLLHLARSETLLGRVSGRVVLPSGAGAANVVVARDVSTAFIQDATGTDAEGYFVLEGVPTGTNVSIGAITLDRRRKGHAWAFVPPDTRELAGVEIKLSAIGKATFTVLAPSGAPLANQEVSLLGVGGFAGVCRNPCGCRTGTTGPDGRVSFPDLPFGAYTGQVVRREGGFTEAATGTAAITSETVPGSAVIQLLGSGTVRGSVSLDSTQATFTGGSVSLTSRQFVNDGLFTCGMVNQESHRGQVNPATSTYEFKGVAIGPVSVTGRADIGVATNKGNLAQAGEVLTLDLRFVDRVAGVLSGRVFLPSGVPAGSGVEVTVNGPLPDVTVTTDASSYFEFAPVLPEGSYSITARDPLTGGVVRQLLYLRRGQDLQHDLRLKGRGTVRVRVEDALGQVVERAFVTLREQEYPQRRHDRSIEPTLLGVATFEDVFEGAFNVEVKDLVGRGGRGSGAVPEPAATVDVSVSLNPTGTVGGRFLMPDGTTPIPYALVTLSVNGRVVGQTTTPGSGELLGRYSFDYVPAGSVRVDAEDPLTLRTGFASGSVESGGTLELPVIAKGLGRVTGEVRARLAGGGEETRPGASVRIEAGSYKGSTLADASGGYEFGGVPEGPVTVTASVGTQALTGSASGSILEDGQALELHVYLRDAGSVSGRVLRSDGTAAPPSRVTIDTTGIGGGRQVTYTREGGGFHFDQVATGRATLTAEELGGIDRGRAAVDVVVGDNDDADVRLNGVGTLVVKARDADGNPVAGDVWLSGSGAFPWEHFVRVPASGESRLPKVLAGPVTAKLRAQPGAATLWGTGTGEVAPDQERELTVALAPSGTVTGRVVRPQSLAAAYGANVTLLFSGGNGQVSLQADESGSFVATGIPLVAFDLRASDPVSGGLAVLRDLEVAANGATLALGDIVLDETAPLVTILSPVEGSTQPGYAGELVFELADEGAGLDLATLVVRYPLGLPSYRSDFTITGQRASAPLDPGRLTAGLNVIRVSVKDLAGRVGEAEVAFRVVGGTIRGDVTLPGGAGPAVGRRVEIYGAAVVTDAQGAFAFEGLRAGNYWVTATDPGTGLAVHQMITLPDAGEKTVHFELPAFMRLSGTVARDGEPVAGIRVTTSDATGSYYRQDVSEADGRYDLGALPLGTYAVEAWNANRLRGRVEGVVLGTPDGSLDLPVPLVAVGRVHGVVTGPGGPADGATVTLYSSADPWGGYFTARAGAGGEYAIDDVPAGPFTISASKGGDQANAAGAIPPAGGPLGLDLVLQPSAVQLPRSLSDAGGTSWFVQKTGALVTSGTRRVFMADSVTPRLTLVRDGAAFAFSGSCPATGACTVASEEDERETVITADDVAGFAVVRKIYVPRDGYFIRILDLVRNDTGAPLTVDILEESEVSASSVRLSSSGDAAAQASDRWLVLDDSNASDIFDLTHPTNSFAPTAFVGWGDGGTAPSSLAAAYQSAIDRTRVSQRWSAVSVLPGDVVGVLQFVAIQSDRARAEESAKRLVQLPPEALAGLELDEAAAILNFELPADLASALEPLPPNDGTVTGSVLGGDRETPVSGASVRFRSQSRYFGRPLLAGTGATGAFSLQGRPDQGTLVPRGDLFEVRATASNAFGNFTATASGRFAAEAGGPAASASVTAAFAGTGVVKGAVRRASGSSVPFSQVALRLGSLTASRSADSAGGYLFLPVPSGSATLTAQHPLGAYAFTTPVFEVPGPCSSTAEGLRCDRVERDVVFPAFGAVEVVVSAGGEAAYADVELLAAGFRRANLTDAATGIYRFVDVPPGAYTVVARGRGLPGSAAAQVTVVADASLAVPLALESPTRLTGRVLGGGLRPVPYQQVSLIGASGGEIRRVSADVNGSFVMDGLPKGSYVLRGEATGTETSGQRSRFEVPVVLDADEQVADALVPAGIAARGEAHLFELTAPAGRLLRISALAFAYSVPVLSSFDLFVFAPDGRLVAAEATSWGSAHVEIESSEPGRYVVAVRAAQAAPGEYRVASSILDDLHAFRPIGGGLVELLLRRGTVPLAGQAVTLENERPELPPAERVRSGATGAGGLFRAALAEGPIVARTVDPATGLPHETRGTLGTGSALSLGIDLPALPSTVRGTVTNGDGGTPLPWAYVTLSPGSRYTYADESGAFRFDDVPPGEYVLSAQYYPELVEEPLVATGSDYVRELRVPIPVVRGQVVEPPPDGSGAAGATVELCFTGFCLTTTADASGAFAFYGPDGAPPAFLRARAHDAPELTTGPVSVPWPAGFAGTIVQPLVLPESVRLAVTVKDADGDVVGQARVELYEDRPGGARLRAGQADEHGVFRARFATAGAVRVHAEDPSLGIPGQERTTLTLGGESTLDVWLAPTGTLEVAILDDGLEPQCGSAMVQAIEQPAAGGGVWSRHLGLCPEVPGYVSLVVPVGAYRVFIPYTDAPGAAEGELAQGELQRVRLLEGTHVRLPRPLPGDEALFVGDSSCPPPCSGFAHTRLEETREDYPPLATLEADGRSLRGLQVATSGVRARRVQYAPASGAFGRTLTLVTNAGTDTATVALDTGLALEHAPAAVATPDGGALGPSQAWAVVQHASGIQGLVLGSAVAPEAFDVVADGVAPPRLASRHSLELAEGETKALLTFTLVGTGADTTSLAARAAALAALSESGALFGLTNEERAAVVNFALPPAGDLRVRVAMGGDAVAGATVGLLDGSGAAVAQVETTPPDGTALFAGLAPGSYTVVAVDGSGRPGRAVVDVPAGTTAAETVELDLELVADDALGSLDVSATWDGGSDPAEAVALALSADGWSPIWRPVAVTDENGLVSFGLVPPGPVHVGPAAANLGGGVTVSSAAGIPTPVPLALEPFATLAGQVTAGDGSTPIANAPVTAVDADTGDVLATGRADASGSYRLELRPGAGGVRVRASSPYDAAVIVESEVLSPPVPGLQDLPALALPLGVIEGPVRLNGAGGGREPDRVVIVAHDSTGRSMLATWIEGDGWSFRIVGPAAGTVVVTAVDVVSGERVSESVELDPGSAVWLYISLGPEPS